MLEPLAKDVWTQSAPLSFFGVRLGTRMTVVRLSSGDLVLHSPVPIDDALGAAIDALGQVRHIVAPSNYHHLYAGHAKERYPAALLYGSPKLARKRSDLQFDRLLPDADFGDELVPMRLDGCILWETVLFHSASSTLVTADLIENFHGAEHRPTRAYLKLMGIWQRPAVSGLVKVAFRDKKSARASVDRILELPIERISLAHGEPITRDARDTLRDSYEWLR